ncbi:MAG: galactokinase, partial [Sphingobacteriales bacterium]
MLLAKTVHDIYVKEFGKAPRIFTAPGRVNIIGEHTDYNGGFVLPAAIDKAAYLAIGPAENGKGRWISVDFNDEVEIDFSHFSRQDKNWPNYLLGVLDQFNRSGKTPAAFNLVLVADIPIGAGLSSSAAIESVIATAVNTINGYGFDKLTLALLAQQAEHEYIGLKCGIMDMYASIHGKKGHVMKIDCRSLTHDYFPLELGDYRIVLLDTGVKHELASSEYNIRRQQCEDGVQFLQKFYTDVKQLRDISSDMLEKHKHEIDPLIFKRFYYVVEENKRVNAICELLKIGSLDRAGQLL